MPPGLSGLSEGMMKHEDEEEDDTIEVAHYAGAGSNGASAASQFHLPEVLEQAEHSHAHSSSMESVIGRRAGYEAAEPMIGLESEIEMGDVEAPLEYDSDQSSSPGDETPFDDSAFAILQSDISNYLQADPSTTQNHPSYNTSTTSSFSQLPPALARYRRPETTNPSDFWHCTPQKWNTWLEEVISNTDKRASSTSAVALRSYHIAGLLMETSEGIDAPSPCQACARQGHICRIYANNASTRCAYCINKHKSHCFSGGDIHPHKRMRMISDTAAERSPRIDSPSKARRTTLPRQPPSAPHTGPNRRPETLDSSNFWYVSPEKWNGWARQAAGTGANSTSARASMRLASRAGIVMESHDSHINNPPCTLCARTGMACKVLASDVGKTCAYCCLRRSKCSNVSADGASVINPHETRSVPTQQRGEPTPPDESAPRFRRPQTKNSADFWHCSVQRWDELHAHYAEAVAEGRESAYRVLQLIDKAGRLMETPEGVDSEVACGSCRGAGERCRFSAVGRKPNERCAYCKLKYRKCDLPEGVARRAGSGSGSVLIRSDVPHPGLKRKRAELEGGSSAVLLPTPSTSMSSSADKLDLEATVSLLQQQVQVLIARDAAREAELQRQSRRVKLMAQNFQRVGADLSKGWKRFLRDEFLDEDEEDEGSAV